MANVEQATITSVMIRRPSREEAGLIVANQARFPGRKMVGIWKEKGETIARATVVPSENPGDIRGLAQSFARSDVLIIESKI